jgi:hypothetical protein
MRVTGCTAAGTRGKSIAASQRINGAPQRRCDRRKRLPAAVFDGFKPVIHRPIVKLTSPNCHINLPFKPGCDGSAAAEQPAPSLDA